MANLPVEVITKPDENGDVQVRPVGHIETILCVEADKLIDPHEADDLTDYRGLAWAWNGKRPPSIPCRVWVVGYDNGYWDCVILPVENSTFSHQQRLAYIEPIIDPHKQMWERFGKWLEGLAGSYLDIDHVRNMWRRIEQEVEGDSQADSE